MAERKSGPVRPPVIDLTAKEATKPATRPASKPATETPLVSEAVAAPAAEAAAAGAADTQPEAPRPVPPRPLARLAMPWSAISIAAVAGALLGTLLTYVTVSFIALPDHRPVIADPSARIAAQDQAIADLSARLASAEAASKTADTTSADASAKLAADLEALRQQVAALPAPVAVDLAPLTSQVASLEDRIAAVSAGASGADATALAETIATLTSGIADLRAALDAVTQRTSAAEAAVTALRGEIDATRSAVASQTSMLGSSDIGPAVRLPLLVSGVESAFANGRPFATELSGLTTLLPDLAVPEPIHAAADSGMPRPDAVALSFTDAVPAILAGRAAVSSGDLTQDAIDWAKGLLALRPMEETEGTTPEAIVSRLEAAVGRRDFVAAAALLDQLPEPMQTAASGVATDIRTLAAADGFIATLRAQALETPTEAPTETPAPELTEATP